MDRNRLETLLEELETVARSFEMLQITCMSNPGNPHDIQRIIEIHRTLFNTAIPLISEIIAIDGKLADHVDEKIFEIELDWVVHQCGLQFSNNDNKDHL